MNQKLKKTTKIKAQFFQAYLKQKNKPPIIPLILRTIDNKKLSEEKIQELSERINREY